MMWLTSLTLRLEWLASCRLAPAPAFSVSRPRPGSCSSSDIGKDQDAPGRNAPPAPLISKSLPRTPIHPDRQRHTTAKSANLQARNIIVRVLGWVRPAPNRRNRLRHAGGGHFRLHREELPCGPRAGVTTHRPCCIVARLYAPTPPWWHCARPRSRASTGEVIDLSLLHPIHSVIGAYAATY